MTSTNPVWTRIAIITGRVIFAGVFAMSTTMKFTDIGGDYVGDGAGFRIGLIHGQRVHALTGLGDEERIGCNENRGDGTAGYEDQLGRKRLHFEIEHLGPNGNRQPEGADVNG